ncbi:hypothetical protein [Hyphomonas johnsonii]|jgi:hypothetical protein|uniref:hypothetical protein n=1 Tax=Hyphomonas johnsonii TaxID=81031 RepID=UPI000AED2135|nr:hypothetical protein [Hyphomonas johnsonii]
MNIHIVLARVASRFWPFARKPKGPPDAHHDRQRVRARLQTTLPPHLLKDVGADDG